MGKQPWLTTTHIRVWRTSSNPSLFHHSADGAFYMTNGPANAKTYRMVHHKDANVLSREMLAQS